GKVHIMTIPAWHCQHKRQQRCTKAPLSGSRAWQASVGGNAERFKTAMLARGSFQVLFQRLRGLVQRVAHGGHLADRVEETVIVNQVFVAHYRYVHTGEIQLARVSQALVAENIVPRYLDQGWRQSLQFLQGCLKWCSVNFVTLRVVRGVSIPKPHHHRS